MYVLQCFFSSACFVIVKNAFFWTERMLKWPHDQDSQPEFYFYFLRKKFNFILSVSGLRCENSTSTWWKTVCKVVEITDDLGGSCRKSCQHLYSCLQPQALQAMVPEHSSAFISMHSLVSRVTPSFPGSFLSRIFPLSPKNMPVLHTFNAKRCSSSLCSEFFRFNYL